MARPRQCTGRWGSPARPPGWGQAPWPFQILLPGAELAGELEGLDRLFPAFNDRNRTGDGGRNGRRETDELEEPRGGCKEEGGHRYNQAERWKGEPGLAGH